MKYKKPIQIIILFMFLELFLVFHNIYNKYIEDQINLSNNMITNNSITLVFYEKEKPDAVYLYNILKNSDVYAIARILKSEDIEIYNFWGELFLKKLNIQNEEQIALVGNNIISSRYCYLNLKNILIFQFENEKYIVKRLENNNSNYMMDNTVFLKAKNSTLEKYDRIIIDSENNTNVKKIADIIMSDYPSYVLETNDNFIERFAYSSSEQKIFNFLATEFELLLLIIIIIVIISYYNEEIKIKYIIGISLAKIILYLEINILQCFVISLFSVFVLYAFTDYISESIKLFSLLLQCFYIYLFVSISLYFFYSISLKLWLNNTIKLTQVIK